MVLVRILLFILLTVDLLMSLHTPVVVAPPPTANGGGDVTAVSGTAVGEQADPSEVVVKKPMPLSTGVL